MLERLVDYYAGMIAMKKQKGKKTEKPTRKMIAVRYETWKRLRHLSIEMDIEMRDLIEELLDFYLKHSGKEIKPS